MRRVLRGGGRAAVCVIGTADQAPMWGVLADGLSRYLPEMRETLNLSFALADPMQLKRLFAAAGFVDVRVEREIRRAAFVSFEAYWEAIEAGVGMLPQAYRSLSGAGRQAVKGQVRDALAKVNVGGHLSMHVEMLIASGAA